MTLIIKFTIGIVLVLLIGVLILSVENRFIYFPTKNLIATPADYGLAFERLDLTSADGVNVMTWAIPYADDAPWLIYFHGNGQNVSHYLSWTTRLHSLGLNVLMLEYRGYGGSEGDVSEEGFYLDADTAYTYLIGSDVDADNIILYGYSLGSGVATELASRHDIAMLILEAPYTSVPDIARDMYKIVPTALMNNRYESKKKIDNIDAPLLVLHASDDRTIPYKYGQNLFALANEPKTFVTLSGGHTALFNENKQQQALNNINKFLAEHLKK